jgi:hypothetical protein
MIFHINEITSSTGLISDIINLSTRGVDVLLICCKAESNVGESKLLLDTLSSFSLLSRPKGYLSLSFTDSMKGFVMISYKNFFLLSNTLSLK